MKKFVATLLSLALALSLGLCVPAFAEGDGTYPPPAVTLTLPEGQTAPEKEQTIRAYRIGTVDTDDGLKYDYEKGTAEVALTVTSLPKGTDITISGLELSGGLSWYPTLTAYSDPDGDGVYHQRIFAYGSGVYDAAPVTQKGPFAPPSNDGGVYYMPKITATGLCFTRGEDGSLTASADKLYQYLGANTLLVVSATLQLPSGKNDGSAVSVACFRLSDPNGPDSGALKVAASGPDGSVAGQPMEFTLRNITAQEMIDGSRYSTIRTVFSRSSETETLALDNVIPLTPGTTATVDGLRTQNGDSAAKEDVVRITAWSDPDGDGVYDQHLYTYKHDQIYIATLNVGQPITVYLIDLIEGALTYYPDLSVLGADSLSIHTYSREDINLVFPGSVSLSADFLTRFFGPDTLIRLSLYRQPRLPNDSSLDLDALCSYFYIPKGQTVPPAFTDVPAWCADAVDWAVGREITNGVTPTQFVPDGPCTVAMILTYLWRAAGEPDSDAPLPADITGKNIDYAETALRWAAEMGIVGQGVDPLAPCTRARAVDCIWRAFHSPTGEGAPYGTFTDVSPTSEGSVGEFTAIHWAAGLGITNGFKTGSTYAFRPDMVCSRGQIVTFLHRAYVEEARLEVNF